MGYDFIIHDHCLSIYFTFSEIISFFSSFGFAVFSFIYQNSRYVAVFITVEIVKERSCAMPSLNMLIYDKIIKQTAKPVV